MANSGPQTNIGGQQLPFGLQSQSSGSIGYNPMMQQSPAPASQMMSPTKELNAVNMCHAGQEIVHEIVSKAQEIFTLLQPKNIQLPNNHNFYGHNYADKKLKLDEHLRQITTNFRKLRLFYTKIIEACEQIDTPSEQELIPYTGKEPEIPRVHSDMYHYISEQHADVVEQVRQKNQQLKEVIDSIRSIIWEINTMITMRKT